MSVFDQSWIRKTCKCNCIRVWNHFSSALLFRHVTIRPALFSVVAKLLKERNAKRKVEAHTYRNSFRRNHLLFVKMIRRKFRNDGTITKNNAHLYKLMEENNMASHRSYLYSQNCYYFPFVVVLLLLSWSLHFYFLDSSSSLALPNSNRFAMFYVVVIIRWYLLVVVWRWWLLARTMFLAVAVQQVLQSVPFNGLNRSGSDLRRPFYIALKSSVISDKSPSSVQCGKFI